jgi:integrase
MRTLKSGNYTKIPLDFTELMSFIRTIDNPEHKLMVAIGTCAAMRVGEIIELQRRDIGRDTITIRKTKCRVDKKTGYKINPYRTIQMPAWLQEMCENIIPLLKLKPEDHVFRYRGHKLTVDGANKRLKQIFDGVDVGDQTITFHTLRRTAAVRMNDSSPDGLLYTQMLLDHKSIATTVVYVRKGVKEFNQSYQQAFG